MAALNHRRGWGSPAQWILFLTVLLVNPPCNTFMHFECFYFFKAKLYLIFIGVWAMGAAGVAAPPVSKKFGQNARNSGKTPEIRAKRPKFGQHFWWLFLEKKILFEWLFLEKNIFLRNFGQFFQANRAPPPQGGLCPYAYVDLQRPPISPPRLSSLLLTAS